MKKGQDTRGYERHIALDTHREYLLVGAWNEEKKWVLTPRRVGIGKFPEWAKKNIQYFTKGVQISKRFPKIGCGSLRRPHPIFGPFQVIS